VSELDTFGYVPDAESCLFGGVPGEIEIITLNDEIIRSGVNIIV